MDETWHRVIKFSCLDEHEDDLGSGDLSHASRDVADDDDVDGESLLERR